MIPWTLKDIDEALRASWAADTCTALVVNDILGGDLMVGEVHLADEQAGYHLWNRLATGIEIDLTREQFRLGQVVTAARLVERPPGPLPRRWAEYELLRDRVAARLGSLPAPAGAR